MDLPEQGAVGEASVTGVGPCPAIEPGPGRVVVKTFRHVRGAVLNLFVAGEAGPIGVTPGHPVWSADRGAWCVPGLRREY